MNSRIMKWVVMATCVLLSVKLSTVHAGQGFETPVVGGGGGHFDSGKFNSGGQSGGGRLGGGQFVGAQFGQGAVRPYGRYGPHGGLYGGRHQPEFGHQPGHQPGFGPQGQRFHEGRVGAVGGGYGR